MDTHKIPYEAFYTLSLFKNYNILLMAIGPANWSKLATVAKIPANINPNPKKFLNEVNNLEGSLGPKL